MFKKAFIAFKFDLNLTNIIDSDPIVFFFSLSSFHLLIWLFLGSFSFYAVNYITYYYTLFLLHIHFINYNLYAIVNKPFGHKKQKESAVLRKIFLKIVSHSKFFFCLVLNLSFFAKTIFSFFFNSFIVFLRVMLLVSLYAFLYT